MARINLNLIDTLTFIKMTVKNIFPNKRPVSCLSSKYHLSIDTKSINKQTNMIYLNKKKQKKIIVGINLNIINTPTFIKTTFKNIFLNKSHVNCSSFRDQLSINSNNMNKQTINSYINKQNYFLLDLI